MSLICNEEDLLDKGNQTPLQSPVTPSKLTPRKINIPSYLGKWLINIAESGQVCVSFVKFALEPDTSMRQAWYSSHWQAWNFIFERARPLPFCKGQFLFHCKIFQRNSSKQRLRYKLHSNCTFSPYNFNQKTNKKFGVGRLKKFNFSYRDLLAITTDVGAN